MEDSSECKLQNFYFANLNSDFHKKNGLFLRAIWILKMTQQNIQFSFEGSGTPYVKMCNVLRKNC